MRNLVKHADIAVENEEDYQKSLGIKVDVGVESENLKVEKNRELSGKVLEKVPDLQRIALTMRESYSENHNGWSAVLNDGSEFLVSKKYDIRDIVYLIGTGETFAAGLIYGINTFGSDQDALEFAVAASCLKQSIPGDLPLISNKVVESLLKSQASGRVQR